MLISGRNSYDYKSVRRWTTQRKLGYSLSECDKIFVPIHQEIHWCLAVINKQDKKFQYLDSLKGMDTRVLKVLARYYVDEVKDKSEKDIDLSSWEQEYVEDLPEQKNGYDCGMFMIKYADFYSRGIELCFNQDCFTLPNPEAVAFAGVLVCWIGQIGQDYLVETTQECDFVCVMILTECCLVVP
ncbi:Ubiquitin-like-specific protease 1A [Vitis vinifera]|uniref:Ubiquitin-like-specific protease 1A n=1 Tax=Vitis vinifera TaxID=29760 RepID=A0A438F6V4_VITVI|nr:Ubiquitin-like-specific protease 1A [Vitis vinifera]RVX21977.1 Ubiquitin-like-specific protease 1A [Vitis vinifera]